MATKCPGCQVNPNALHTASCSVAPCKECGHPNRGEHDPACPQSPLRAKTKWTGDPPGTTEAAKHGLRDTTELVDLYTDGLMTWDTTAEEWKPFVEYPGRDWEGEKVRHRIRKDRFRT